MRQGIPHLSAGVLAFDILIANEDRHDKNLLVDKVMKPTAMHVYDHDQALIGGHLDHGAERFEKLKDRLGVTGSPVTGGNKQVFLDHVEYSADLYDWVGRIHDIPDWFIVDICKESQRIGLDRETAEGAVEFLRYRRTNLRQIIDNRRKDFPSISDWPSQLQLPQL